MTDLRGLDLSHCKLVVLSSCSTGLRDSALVGWTDIYAGFGAQLLANGCRNVVVTLAPVSDRRTSALMIEIYRNYFAHGMSIAKSLRDALLKVEKCGGTELKQMTKKQADARLTKKRPGVQDNFQRNLLQFVHIGTD